MISILVFFWFRTRSICEIIINESGTVSEIKMNRDEKDKKL